ncbi:transporter substrate-binding domain-containing protein [Paenibacillus piri]|uniref:histidine kinase n=1 Tax=Paenibacillus piri TaxID=2547395 RepID=A0A4R5KYN9_9BACL|nr:transporter substrate-binding domain-containing protein [Paenibacillus piri]TDG00369.1 transporter substrate-binding domain-containing protein [Paenibacillus piri]
MRKLLLWLLVLLCFSANSGWAAETDSPPPGNVLKVGFERDHPPFSFVDEAGNPTGFNVELMGLIAKRLGVELKFVPVETSDFAEQLGRGTVDLILGVKYSAARSELVDFSDSFLSLSEALVVPKENKEIYNLSGLKGKVASVQRGSSAIDILGDIRDVRMNIASSQTKALELLLHGRADAFIGDYEVVRYYFTKHKLDSEYDVRINSIHSYEIAFAVRKGNYELARQLNEGIKQLQQNGELKRIYNAWFAPLFPQDTLWKQISWILGLVSIAVFVFMLFVYMINKRLKKEIWRHTKTLKNYLIFQQQILDTIDNGIFSINTNKTIQLANRRAMEIWNLKTEPVNTCISGSSLFKEIEQIIDLPLDENDHEGEFVLIREGAEEKLVHYYAAVLKNDFDEKLGWIISMQDRTKEKNLQNKLVLQEKLRSLGQLIAGIAHELRNPLTSMKVFIELLPRKIDDHRYRQEFMKHVPAELHRLNHVVEDLLDYTRSKVPVKERVNLHEFLSSVIKPFELQYAFQPIQLINLAEKGTSFYFDKQQMKQVFINIITNAVDAIAESEVKMITFEAGTIDGYPYIRVHDTGAGIPAHEISKLFQPFHTTKNNGVGLGLYICYQIMAEHGGEIAVQSVPGKGTTFTLKFPGAGGEFLCTPS